MSIEDLSELIHDLKNSNRAARVSVKLVSEVGKAVRSPQAAERLGDSGGEVQPLALERLREQLAANDLAIVNGAGQVLLSVARSADLQKPDRPSPTLLSNARHSRVAARIEGLDDDGSGAPAPGSGPARP